MSRTVIDLDDGTVAEAIRLYGITTKAAAVRAAMEDAVKRRLRCEFRDAIRNAGIVESTGPRNRDGSLRKHHPPSRPASARSTGTWRPRSSRS
ncbi:type II toxin-antitoxin system VapB family antitoxin [Streptomyces radiopugnans]|uniref:Antitoxin of type II TA system, VapB n=1 Tax=Streptomyces radiopugnans TaxID=403935 RepID=A0A1H9GPT7_9ACTN|nr:type II toxin-antitoxin system VapB family antitoxin [Streptomyces radiopugnans]SEQ52050.1 antitoxin of type II TA system, VapB [Streptomyces radiopugnans]